MGATGFEPAVALYGLQIYSLVQSSNVAALPYTDMWDRREMKIAFHSLFTFMIPRYTQEEFNSAKGMDKLPCECEACHDVFHKEKRYIANHLKNPNNRNGCKYCSQSCHGSVTKLSQMLTCYCGRTFEKMMKEIKRSPNHFCSRSCAATHNNTHKTHGTRRSKLEEWLEQQLPALYPSLEFHFNRKDAINAELDIYVPSMKLAFELNGLFHYEPIFGADKLAQIQNNDQRKYQACIEHGIELCLIDVSSFKNFKEKGAIKYLDVIKGIIDTKL